MLYFRFDKTKEDFKAQDHYSVFMSDAVYQYCDDLFESGEAPSEYQSEYDNGNFDIIEDFIENELTLDGCSCFELNNNGLQEAQNYNFFNTDDIVTVFEGDFVDYGHDDETVAKCNKILDQLSIEEFLTKYSIQLNM